MSRSVLVPLLALAALVLYGTTSASRHSADAARGEAGPRVLSIDPPVIELEPAAPIRPAAPPAASERPADTLAAAASGAEATARAGR